MQLSRGAGPYPRQEGGSGCWQQGYMNMVGVSEQIFIGNHAQRSLTVCIDPQNSRTESPSKTSWDVALPTQLLVETATTFWKRRPPDPIMAGAFAPQSQLKCHIPPKQ